MSFGISRATSHVCEIAVPFWARIVVDNQLTLPLLDSSSPKNEYDDYLSALANALREPNDANLDMQARQLMELLSDRPIWRYTCDVLLGPSPNQFESRDDWIAYKAGIRQLSKESAQARRLQEPAPAKDSIEIDSNESLLLLFPPRQWQHLVLTRMISEESVNRVQQQRWAQLSTLPIGFIQFDGNYFEGFRSGSSLTYSVVQLLKVAVELHRQGELYEANQITLVLGTADSSTVSVEEIKLIIENITNPSLFPRTWASALVEFASRVPSIDSSILSTFWGNLTDQRPSQVWIPFNPSRDIALALPVIRGLLLADTDSALSLVVNLASAYTDMPLDVATVLNGRICSRLRTACTNGIDVPTLIRGLVLSQPSLQEVELYADADLYLLLANNHREIDSRVVDRLA
ncbi:MAG TPA: hypothetical protein VM260_17210, partial [Pirellula sp.]|nr:hypothetical protein [Pirellula sp.]